MVARGERKMEENWFDEIMEYCNRNKNHTDEKFVELRSLVIEKVLIEVNKGK